jgi:L-iditol 2-dehydrogenase
VSDIPKTMRAVVYRGVNDLRLETVPVPRIGANELLVRVAVCGVCPTDIKKIHYGTVPPPRIFGHETAGTIVKTGARVRGFKIGDRVALHHHVPCLDCHFCRHRAFAQCPQYKRTGITAGFEPAGGGYAEYVRVMNFVLPGVVKIPARNTFAEGAMLEPVNTVLKAIRRLNLLRGDTVLVAGQGPIGLMFTRLLKLSGVNVIATDLLQSRLRLAKKFGAKRTILADQLSTINDQLDSAIIAVPSDAAAQEALRLVRGGGQVLLFAHTRRNALASSLTGSGRDGALRRPVSHPMGEVGVMVGTARCAVRTNQGRDDMVGTRPTASQTRSVGGAGLDLASICLDEKDLLGSYSSDFTLQAEVARLVFSRRLDVRSLISHCFPLAETTTAVQLASKPTENSLKILVGAIACDARA